MVQMFRDNDTSRVLDTHDGTSDNEAEEQAATDEGQADKDYWLKCSLCRKWRRVPGSYKSEHQNWLCTDHPNPTRCADEQESDESEKEQETEQDGEMACTGGCTGKWSQYSFEELDWLEDPLAADHGLWHVLWVAVCLCSRTMFRAHTDGFCPQVLCSVCNVAITPMSPV